ncbi:hypothetical protein JOQ06_029034, partial [Pogonophryne albipinna]
IFHNTARVLMRRKEALGEPFFSGPEKARVGAERLLFFEKLKHTLSTCDSEEYLFLGGDFNCTENPVLDRNHQEPHAASKSAFIRLTESFELCDVWRHFHPGQRQYTW